HSTLIQLDEPTLAGLAVSGEHLDFMHRMEYRSAIVAPLRARNRTYGAISWLRFEDQPAYEEEDLELVEELASRAALALSNAHLMRTGAAEFHRVVPAALLDQVAVDADHLERLRALDISSALTVPLAARGRILGAMTLATQGDRFLSEHDLTLALELGARAGLS